jgi:hypothetical protein
MVVLGRHIMSRKRDSLGSLTTTSGANTENALVVKSDLDAFVPSPPQHRLDDKAASLEDEILGLKAEFRRERFVYAFVIVFLFNCFVGSVGPAGVFALSIVASLIFLIAMGKWLKFPWAMKSLERWHNLCLEFAERKIRGKPPAEEETEP